MTSRSRSVEPPAASRGTPGVWRLRVHLQPRAARTRVVGPHGNAIKIQVQAPPVDGAANAALIGVLAETLALPRAAIRIVHGATAREKVVEIQTDDVAACRQRLQACWRVDKAATAD